VGDFTLQYGGWARCTDVSVDHSISILDYKRTALVENDVAVTIRDAGERKGAYGILMRRREGKEPLGRPSLREEDNIKME
jgi:hypothetical protein